MVKKPQTYVKKATIILNGYVRERTYPGATQMTKYNLIRVIKDQAVSGEAEAMLNHISGLPWPHT